MSERGEAQRHHRNEALTPGQDLGVVAMFGQQPYCLVHAFWGVVFETTRFHVPPSEAVSAATVLPPRGTRTRRAPYPSSGFVAGLLAGG